MRARLAALVLLIGLPACGGLEPDFQKSSSVRLKGGEITTLLDGRTINLSNPRGRSYTNSFGHDGRVLISGAKGNQNGDWKVVGDRYCLTLDEDKREQCMEIYRLPDGTFQMVNADGSLRNTFKVQ